MPLALKSKKKAEGRNVRVRRGRPQEKQTKRDKKKEAAAKTSEVRVDRDGRADPGWGGRRGEHLQNICLNSGG